MKVVSYSLARIKEASTVVATGVGADALDALIADPHNWLAWLQLVASIAGALMRG